MSYSMLTLREKLINFAVTSRLFVIGLQFISNFLIPDHDAKSFISPYNPNEKLGIFDFIVNFLFGGFVRWDAQYFLHIAEHGYTYENCLAFFPLTSLLAQFLTSTVLCPFSILFTERSLLIISFLAINFYCFVKAAKVLYDLSLTVLRNEEMAYRSAIFFCINPASIFFTAPYSESVFVLATFYGMLCSERDNEKHSSLSFSFACAARANGLINIGFIIYKSIRQFLYEISFKTYVFIILIPLQLISTLIPMLASIFVIFLPFVLFQVFSFGKFCIDRQTFPKFILDHANEYGYKLAGTLPSSWCNSSLPLAYSYVQSFYWKVGFLQYYQIKQFPNFLLASPIILFLSYFCWEFLKRYPKYSLSLGMIKDQKTEVTKGQIKLPPCEALPYILHAMVLLILCIFNVHIQVTTRMLASSSPVLYWAASYISAPYNYNKKAPNKVETKTNMTSKWNVFILNQDYASHMNAKLIKFYFVSYVVIGTILFSNFLPWT